MSTPVLTADLSENLHLPGGLPQPIARLVFETESKTILFDDGARVYGYSARCRRIFAIAPQAQLNGWSYDGSSLFLQDGPVLCQYDLMSLDPRSDAWPVKALNLETRHKWSSDGSTDDFKALFPSPASTSQFSAPVVWNRDSSGVFVHVLMVADSPKIVRVPASLDPHPFEAWSTPASPDAPIELFAIDSAEGPILQYLSGGQVLSVRMHPLAQLNQQGPPESAGHWQRLSRANTINVTGPAQQSIPIPAGRGDDDLWVSAFSSQDWQLYVAPNHAGAKARIGLATGAGAPLGGDLGADADPRTLRSTVALVQEHHENFAFLLAADNQNSIRLEKYKLAEPFGGASRHSRVLIDSQLRGIPAWLVAGAKGTSAWTQAVPFDANSTVVCAGSVLESLGIADAAIAGKLAAAGSAAASRMMAVSAQSNTAIPVAAAVYQLCGVPLTTLLADGFHDPTQTATALRAAGLPVIDVLRYLAPASLAHYRFSGWWQGPYVRHSNPFAWPPRPPEPQPVSDQGIAVAAVIKAAGYSPQEVVQSLVVSASNVDLLYATVAIFKSAYGFDYNTSQSTVMQSGGSRGMPSGELSSNLSIPLCNYYAAGCLGWS
jgi:hypothetical protein